MSSTVNLDMCLIASKGLLPETTLHKVFMDTLEELNGSINNSVLSINNNRIGKISLKDRIIIQTYSEHANEVRRATEKLREVFTRRAKVAIDNYSYELEQEKKRAQESDLAYAELMKRINSIDKQIEDQQKAIKKREMSSCDAIVLELKEAAENQGYDIVEEKTNNGVQLQFVRRTY